MQGVQFCSKLFDCERYSKAKKHTAEQRKQFRFEKEKPILDAFWNWLDQQRPNKGTRLAKAVNYAQNRKDTLMTYLEDGHCSLSMLWSSIFVTLMANKIGGLQFGIYRNCQISSRVFHTAVAALPLTKANRSDFE